MKETIETGRAHRGIAPMKAAFLLRIHQSPRSRARQQEPFVVCFPCRSPQDNQESRCNHSSSAIQFHWLVSPPHTSLQVWRDHVATNRQSPHLAPQLIFAFDQASVFQAIFSIDVVDPASARGLAQFFFPLVASEKKHAWMQGAA